MTRTSTEFIDANFYSKPNKIHSLTKVSLCLTLITNFYLILQAITSCMLLYLVAINVKLQFTPIGDNTKHTFNYLHSSCPTMLFAKAVVVCNTKSVYRQFIRIGYTRIQYTYSVWIIYSIIFIRVFCISIPSCSRMSYCRSLCLLRTI